ncbi:MAG: O-antigen ligase family protein [Bacteroidales bacterium]|nr:O-antigen ligase family protein [Bacteroidales bacterium]
MTGPFDNPGPYGGFVAVLLAVSVFWTVSVWGDAWKEGWRKELPWKTWALRGMVTLSTLACACGALVVAASWSRTAWAGLTVALLVFLLREKPMEGGRRPGKKGVAAIVVTLILLAALAFVMKKDSALGRLHIWHMEAKVIAKNPIKGVGEEYYLGAYGDAQAEYFRAKERPAMIRSVAGCPEYAFNEYLKYGMIYGVGGLLLSLALAVAVIVILLRGRSPFAYGALVYAVFAFGSYPLSLWQFRLLGLFLLADALLTALRNQKSAFLTAAAVTIILSPIVLVKTVKSERVKREGEDQVRFPGQLSAIGYYEEAIEEYSQLPEEIERDYRALYGYGYALFKTGRFTEATEVLSRGAALSCDPMFHVIAGRCLEADGKAEDAEAEYRYAHWMVPCRLYPLVLLMEMYGRQGRTREATELREEILSMPVNPRNAGMKELHDRARKFNPEES